MGRIMIVLLNMTPVNKCILKVNDKNKRRRWNMFKVNDIDTRRHWRRSGAFIVSFDYILQLESCK